MKRQGIDYKFQSSTDPHKGNKIHYKMIMFIAIDGHSFLYGKGTSMTFINNNKN